MRGRTTPPPESPVKDSEDVDGRGDEDEEEEVEEVEEKKTQPRGKAFVRFLSSGSRGSEGSPPLAAPAAVAPLPAAEVAAAPATSVAFPSPSTRPTPPPAPAAATKTSESKAREAPDGCEAKEEDGGGEPSNKDKLSGRSNDGEQVESPADDNVVNAPSTVGGFRPKMPRKRMALIVTEDPTSSHRYELSPSTLEKQRPTEQEDPSKKLNQINISREKYHSRVCLPRRRRLAARQRKVLSAMNKKAVGIYGSIPFSDKLKESLPLPPLANATGEDSGSIARYFRGPSGGSSASRDSSNHLAGRGGGWESGARRRAVIASPDRGRSSPPWDLRNKASMRGSFPLDDIATPVSFGRDHLAGLMPGMSPAIDLKALRNGGGMQSSAMLGSIGGRGDGRVGMDELRDMMFRNPELWEEMMRTINAGGGPMMGRGLTGTQSAGGGFETNRDPSNIPGTPITALGGGGYHYGGTTNNANVFNSLHGKRKYPTDSLYGACGSVGMMDDDSSNNISKSPGNPKKSFLQRERVMDAEMRNHMREVLLKGSSGISDDRNRNSNLDDVNIPFNRNTICMDTIDALNVDTVVNSKSNSKSSRDENQAPKKKTDPPAPKKSKKSKKTISGPNTAQKKSTASNSKKSQIDLNATIIDVVELPGKPKRPFSLYNLFFQLEREFILHEIREGRKPSSSAEGEQSVATCNTLATALTGKASSTANPQTDSDDFYDPDIPARYSHLRLEKHWYSVGNKQKRKHRKTEGSCSFMDLTRMVSACWKDIDITDPYIKKYCQKLAKEELEVYKKNVDQYKKAMKRAELLEEAKAKALLSIEEKGADLPPTVDPASTKKSKSPKRSADEGAPEYNKKLKRDVDEDTSVKSKETNKLEGRPFTADNQNPQHPDYGRSRLGRVGAMVDVNDHMMRGGDMSRFAEMARMGISFPGFRGGGGRNDDDPRGMRMDGVARSSSGDRAMEATALAVLMAEKRMVEKRMAEIQMTAGARDDRGGGGDKSSMADARGFFDGTAIRMRDASQMTNTRMPADDQRMFDPREDDHEGMNLPSVPSDIQQKFAALAEAEARHRTQIEMQSGMIGNRNKGRGAWRDMDRGGPHDPYQRSDMFPPGANGMRRMPQGSTSPRSRSRQMGQNSFPQDFGGPSSMQRKFMEQFGIDLSQGRGVGNAPAHYPRDGGADIPQEQEFDIEVDHFLSTLKEEIKENRRKQLMRAGASGGSGGSSVNAPFMRAGIGGNTASTPSSVGNNSRLGGATGYQEPTSPMLMGSMMGMNAQMMDQMTRRMNGSFAGGSFGFGNYGSGPSPNQPSPAMMEELRRRQVAAAGNSQGGGSMPALPFYGTDNIRRQQEGWGGGGGRGDDDPALPEYGWGDEGS